MLVKRGGFLQCPFCGNRKLLRVEATTEARELPVWCRKCQREITVDIARGQCRMSRSPGQSVKD
jgi:transcription elongation factor Elf1